MTELIVALDTGESIWRIDALRKAGVMFFKLSASVMMEPSFFDVLHMLGSIDADWFADLKLYDTRDSVERIARRAFELGARFLTVHATPPMLEAAMRAKPAGDTCKVLAVGQLTDGSGAGETISVRNTLYPDLFDGMIVPVKACATAKAVYYNKLIVCPGIRHHEDSMDNHVHPATPSEAKAAGADYIVVGRPIIDADDPVAAALAIMAEIA